LHKLTGPVHKCNKLRCYLGCCCHAGSLNLFPSPSYTARDAQHSTTIIIIATFYESWPAKCNGCIGARFIDARTFCTSSESILLLSRHAHLLLILEILFVVQLTAAKMCRDMSLTDLAYVLAFSAMRSGAFNTPHYI
jgi:hypothetical protein